MLNGIFFVLIAGSVLTAAFNGTMPKVTEASLEAASSAVQLSIKLVGQMALWLGFFGIDLGTHATGAALMQYPTGPLPGHNLVRLA